MTGEAKRPLLADDSEAMRYEPPWELLHEADFTRVNASCSETSLFVKAGTIVGPFERMQFLRGTEQLFVDMAHGSRVFSSLLSRLHGFYLEEISLWYQNDVDGITFMDDWGAQNGPLISPEMWRAYFKPLYKEYCDLIHGVGKWVFFHSDGHVTSIPRT